MTGNIRSFALEEQEKHKKIAAKIKMEEMETEEYETMASTQKKDSICGEISPVKLGDEDQHTYLRKRS